MNNSFTKLASLVLTAVVALSLLASSIAHADVCVQLDATKDTLSEADQKGAKMMLEQTFRNLGAPLGPNCTENYMVHHVNLGQSVNVFLQGPQGYRQGRAEGVEELPNVYDQLVRSLTTGASVNATGTAVTRANVTSAQEAPRRIEADSLWYARLGYGNTLASNSVSGPAMGFGYRYELDQVAVDFSFLNLVVSDSNSKSDSDSSAGVSGSLVKLMALYFFNSLSNNSAYIGGGVGWGLTSFTSSTLGDTYSGGGLQGEFSLGYEFLRASSIRMFAQADASVPFYKATQHNFNGTSDSKWAPTIAASLGIGWGRGLRRVRVVY